LKQGAVLAALVVIFIGTLPCAAQQSTESHVIAWAELDSGELGDEFRNASVLVPRQLRAALYFLKDRYPDPEESAQFFGRAKSSALEAARTALASAKAARDLIALTVRDPDQRLMDLEKAEKAVLEARTKLSELLSVDPDYPEQELDSIPAIPVSHLVDQSEGMLIAPVQDPVATCAEKKVDILVYGRIRPSGSFLIIEMAVFNAVLGRDVWSGTDYSAPDALDLVVDSLTRPIAEALLGKPYALVTYRTDPPDAELTVEGKRVDSAYHLFFEEGFHEYSAEAPGYQPFTSFFSSTPGKNLTIEISLKQLPSVGFALESDPQGAKIHLDGVQLGNAPVVVEGVAFPRVIRMSMPGFEDVQMTVRPESLLEDMTISMLPSDGLSFDGRFDDKKARFYHSLGWFIVSLPVTVLTGGLFQTYYNASTEAQDRYGTSIDSALRDFLNNRFYLTQTAFWASASISVGLAANAAFKLSSYIGTAN